MSPGHFWAHTVRALRHLLLDGPLELLVVNHVLAPLGHARVDRLTQHLAELHRPGVGPPRPHVAAIRSTGDLRLSESPWQAPGRTTSHFVPGCGLHQEVVKHAREVAQKGVVPGAPSPSSSPGLDNRAPWPRGRRTLSRSGPAMTEAGDSQPVRSTAHQPHGALAACIAAPRRRPAFSRRCT